VIDELSEKGSRGNQQYFAASARYYTTAFLTKEALSSN
jgi:hypothetical protein